MARPATAACCVVGVVLLALASPAAALDPSRAITQYGHEAWTRQNGLPGDSVYQVASTPDGYIWLRTSSGLVRFDGARFTPIDPRGPQEPSDTVRAICRSVDGGLLVRGAQQTHVYRAGEFASYLPQQPLPGGVVRLILQTRDRRLWIGSDNYVYASQAPPPAGPPTSEAEEPALIIRNTGWVSAFLEDRAGRLWIGAAYALYRYEGGKITTYSKEITGRGVTAIAEGPDGTLWLGTRNGLVILDDGRIEAPPGLPAALGTSLITALVVDHDGSLWVGTGARGLHRLSRGRWSSATIADGLLDDAVLSVSEDNAGSIWVGTKGGLDRFRNTKLVTLTAREGLASDDVSAVLEARDGSVFVFCDGGGLTRIRNGALETYTTRDGLGSLYGGSLYEARDGSVWIGTGSGVTRFRDGRLTPYTAGGRLAHVYVSAVGEDDEGLIVATAEPAVYRFRDGKLSDLTVDGKPIPGLDPGAYVFAMHRDGEGTLWISSGARLFSIPRGRPPGPPADGISFYVTSIHDDGRGSLWLAGRQPGVTRLRVADGRVTHYTTKDGLLDDSIIRALTDDAGNLWASCPRGIFTVRRESLDAFAEGRLAAVRSEAFDVSDGMKTTEASLAEHQPAGWRGADGRLWFATRKGVVIVDPAHMPRNRIVPSVFVEELVVDDETLPWPKDVDVGPGKSKWEMRFTALNLLVPERARFKYHLEGYDRDWVDAGPRRSAYYTKLPPRTYRFHVIASNEDGVWNEAGAAFTLRVAPSLFETVWFRSLAGFVAVLAVLGAHRWRTVTLRRREQELVRVVDERTRDLQAEIVERRQTEANLRREQALLDAVLDHIPDNVYFKDLESRFTRVNRALTSWLGLADPSEAIGRTDADFFDAAHAAEARRDEEAIIESGRPLAGKEERETWPGGRETWVLTTKIPLRDASGAVVGTMGISRDITARKRMEDDLNRYKEGLEEQVAEQTAELRRAEERYRTIFENAEEGIFRWAPAGEFLVANPAMARILGYDSPDALVAGSKAKPWTRKGHELTLGALLTGRESVERVVAEARRADGRRIWISVSARAVRAPDGSVAYFEGTAEDVTERRRAEEAEALLRRALKKSAREWETTFDALEAAIVIVDPETRVVRLNRAAVRVAERTFSEALGLPVAELRGGEPWKQAAEAARSVARTGAAAQFQAVDAVRGQTWEVAAFPSPDVEGSGGRTIVVARDVTPLVELQDSLRRSETMSAMGLLVAGVAHEVRNPLFSISATLDAFEAKMGANSNFDPVIARLRTEVGRLATVMEGLLDYGKLTRLDLTPGSIAAVVAEAVESCGSLAAGRRVAVVDEVAADLPDVVMDRKRMVQVFQNLLQNAVQHAPAGSVVRVRSAPVERDDRGRARLVVRVEDSGPGFPTDVVHRVFEPFFSQRRGGTGLGLAIVRRIVEDHGGSVSAGNREEGGAVMTVLLPAG